jgi:hypothetical protein
MEENDYVEPVFNGPPIGSFLVSAVAEVSGPANHLHRQFRRFALVRLSDFIRPIDTVVVADQDDLDPLAKVIGYAV